MRFDMDSLNSTALSYKGSDEKKVGGPAIPRQWDMPETSLQPLDIAALQHLYGKNTGHNPENTLYHLGDKRVSFTIDDAGGFNVISARGYEGKKGEGVRLDLRNENPGHMSIVGGTRTWIADGTHIQGAQGSNGDDRIFSGGHGYKYHLEGGEGKDTFYISRHSKTELLDYRMAEGDKLVFHKGEFDNVKLYHNKSDNSIYIQAEHKDGHISEVLINGGEHNEVMAQLKTDHPELRIEDKGQISTLKLKAMEQCTKLNNELVAKGVTNRTPFLERAFEMHNAVAGAIVSGAVDAFNRGVGLDSDTRAARTSRGERPAPGSPPIERGEFDHEFFVAPGAKKSSPAR